ncbi:hypothetical protein SKAU_G00266640 [Synaphobranchus kaupii]|uniref:Uncharacterized protein n=1 Tax=Synaphobranchus kaupii TaxID=118154 RepID=A0A9Q1IP85_SYNKA|nr:hypothetical protein SKAU_G00266640 [Synaphobranchus kaupii]
MRLRHVAWQQGSVVNGYKGGLTSPGAGTQAAEVAPQPSLTGTSGRSRVVGPEKGAAGSGQRTGETAFQRGPWTRIPVPSPRRRGKRLGSPGSLFVGLDGGYERTHGRRR